MPARLAGQNTRGASPGAAQKLVFVLGGSSLGICARRICPAPAFGRGENDFVLKNICNGHAFCGRSSFFAVTTRKHSISSNSWRNTS